jgi:hypothetical protein
MTSKGKPGEVIYFGFGTELGIGTLDALDDRSGPNVTDKLRTSPAQLQAVGWSDGVLWCG